MEINIVAPETMDAAQLGEFQALAVSVLRSAPIQGYLVGEPQF